MDLFAPEYLPGVGMGDLTSVVGICGALGMAATAGMLLAEGAIGTTLFVASAIALLSRKPDFGESVPAVAFILALLSIATIIRTVLIVRARRAGANLAGTATGDEAAVALRTSVARRESRARSLSIISVVYGGAAVGFAWAEWNEVPLRLEDAESVVGLAVGVVAASVGGDAAYRFIAGAIRAGGSPALVGIALSLVALGLNAASVYIPFAGAIVVALALLAVLRLRRREHGRHRGLRILS